MKKKFLRSFLAAFSCALLVCTTGCSVTVSESGLPKQDKPAVEHSTESKEVEDTKENEKDEVVGFKSSDDVINAFWTSMKELDKDLMTSCFYEKADTATNAVESNLTAAETAKAYTEYFLEDITITENAEDAESVVKELNYTNYDAVEHYDVIVPVVQTIDNVKYEVNDIYDIVTISIDDCWYIVRLTEVDVVITNQTDLSNTTTEENSSEATEESTTEQTTEDNTSNNDVTVSEGFSSTYADKDLRAFKLNGKMYVLGKNTLQDLIDDGVKFEDTANANNNIKPNYESERFTILLNDEEYYYCNVNVANFTEENKTIAECPITAISIYGVNEAKCVENTIEFAFPLTLTEEDLRSNSGEPSYYHEYVSDDSTYVSHDLEYKWEGTKYIGSSGYSFDFVNGVLKDLSIEFEP